MPQTLIPDEKDTDTTPIHDREPVDPNSDFVNRMTTHFEKADEARFAEEHPEEVEDSGEETDEEDDAGTADDESGEAAEDDTESDESDDAAGQSDEDEDTSTDEDDEEDPGEEDDESATDSDDAEAEAETKVGDDVGEVEEESDPVGEEFRAFAKRAGIDVSLEDVPKGKAREVAVQKIRQMESGYTRAMQDLRGYRGEQLKYAADEKFRKENTALHIVELLRQGGQKLSDEVNARIEKLGDPDLVEALETVTKGKREKAEREVQAQRDAQEQAGQQAFHVESLARRLAQRAGLPWEFADRAVASEIALRGEKGRNISDDDINDIIRGEAANYSRHVRAHRREASKEAIKQRTETRKKHATPGRHTPTNSASPKPGTPKKKKINYNNEDERRAPMMEFAKRKFKGAIDG